MSATEEETYWTRAREVLARDWRLLIDGELVPASGQRTFEVTSPVTEQVIARVPDSDADQVATAVAAGARAFPAWRDVAPVERAALVGRMADVIEEHVDDLALLDAVDGGASIKVMAGDVHWAAEWCRYYAGLALEMKGHSIPSAHGSHFSVREPIGVVARIFPFNHPIMFAVKALAAPLVAGNSVILKPSETTPLSALHLAELVRGIFPPGVVQLVLGNGPEVPRALVRHPEIRRIAFTGSVPTGQAILRDAADTGIKDVTLELGGKNALIAYPDADPAEVAAGAVQGMNFTWSGQSCGSTSRLIVHESIADDVVAAIVRQLRDWRVGSPLDPDNDQGPLVSERQYRKVQELIGVAVADGAKLVTGGGRPAHLGTGYYIEPTIFDHVAPAATIAQEEVFGPVLSVIRWADSDDPVAIANSVRYGLTGSVYTNDVRRAHRVANSLQAGFVWVNETARHFTGMPFGGYQDSGLGREESLDELLSFTQQKSINVLY
ncbi:MAG TPA: aldehyde dehydrogenase family protein [Trebonia sp.]